MVDRRTARGLGERGLAALSPHFTLGTLVLLGALPILLVAMLVPQVAVLPTLSLSALTLAAGTAAIAWWRKASRRGNTITLWDVAGALMLIGCAAAMMTQPEHLLEVFGHKQNP
jgi:hypothetical protein